MKAKLGASNQARILIHPMKYPFFGPFPGAAAEQRGAVYSFVFFLLAMMVDLTEYDAFLRPLV
jgi:hypothetical protein